MYARDRIRNHLVRRRIPLVALVAYVIALLAWVALIRHWVPMPGSEPGDGGHHHGTSGHDHHAATGVHDHHTGSALSDPGVPEAMALANGGSGMLLYLLMWGVMMIAMMYPSTVPLFRLYNGTLRGMTGFGRATRLGAFMGTYALVWAATGIVPLTVNLLFPFAIISEGSSALFLGGSLLVLSAYQLSSYKHRCLDYCRSPLGFLTEHHRPGVGGAVSLSGRFSLFCIGCCWALMGLMVVVGSMNLLWMAAITVVISLERLVSWGDWLATAIGVASGIAGVGLIIVGWPVLIG